MSKKYISASSPSDTNATTRMLIGERTAEVLCKMSEHSVRAGKSRGIHNHKPMLRRHLRHQYWFPVWTSHIQLLYLSGDYIPYYMLTFILCEDF